MNAYVIIILQVPVERISAWTDARHSVPYDKTTTKKKIEEW
jgi:hypothetical protein